jgi:hypothetical protein
LRAQKKKQEKGTPTSPGPAGFPYFSPGAGRGKNRASPSNSSRVFSAPACEARQDKWGGGKISHWNAAEHRRERKKGQPPSSSLQKNGSGVKKFGFKNNHTSENVPLVPKFGLERWGGSQTKTKGEVPCLSLP